MCSSMSELGLTDLENQNFVVHNKNGSFDSDFEVIMIGVMQNWMGYVMLVYNIREKNEWAGIRWKEITPPCDVWSLYASIILHHVYSSFYSHSFDVVANIDLNNVLLVLWSDYSSIKVALTRCNWTRITEHYRKATNCISFWDDILKLIGPPDVYYVLAKDLKVVWASLFAYAQWQTRLASKHGFFVQ